VYVRAEDMWEFCGWWEPMYRVFDEQGGYWADCWLQGLQLFKRERKVV